MHISFCVHFRRCVEAVDAQNHLGEKWRRMSDVSRKVRAGGRHCPGVAVPGRHDQCASPDSLRPSRYSFFHDVCIVSLSGKSLSCVSVCNVEMQCLLAKWLILVCGYCTCFFTIKCKPDSYDYGLAAARTFHICNYRPMIDYNTRFPLYSPTLVDQAIAHTASQHKRLHNRVAVMGSAGSGFST